MALTNNTAMNKALVHKMEITADYKNMLDDCYEYLKLSTKQTGAFIGELVTPIKSQDPSSQYIQNVGACNDHSFMKK